jgi:RNA 3'-terminal phosphate cyclase (ATP)
MLVIDGSKGEGGGQVLRTSLALAIVTGRPVRIENIRAKRDKPGLRRQHLMAVQAAATISGATLSGDCLASRQISFTPGLVRAGHYTFDIGSAGSTTLVLQTVLPPLLVADGPSSVELIGGTHNPFAPPFDFLDRAFLPLVDRMGARVAMTLQRPGFYPAGGGRLRVEISPGPLRRLELLERGEIRSIVCRAVVSSLPDHIAKRELTAVAERLGLADESLELRRYERLGPGNLVMIEVESESLRELFTGFGRRGVPAEKVASEAADEAERYLAANVPVAEHLADQLLLPLTLAGGGALVTLPPSSHTTTNIDTIRRFLDVTISLRELSAERWRIDVDP